MKKIILLSSFTFIFLIVAKAQIPNYVFNNRDDVYDHNPDSCIKPYYWNNGILYLGFCYDSTQAHEGTTITFYDTLGNLKWKDTIMNYAYRYFQGNDIISLSDYSFYITGVMWKDTLTQWDRFIAKFNANGDSIFYKYYIDSASTWAMSIIKFSSDTLLLLSDLQIKNGDDTVKIILSKVDSMGSIIFNSVSTPRLTPGYQVIKDDNGRIYVGGTLKTAPGNNYHTKVFINVYDYNLNELANWYPSLELNEDLLNLNLWNNRLYLTSSVTTYYQPNNNYGAFYQCRFGEINRSTGSYVKYKNFGSITTGGTSLGIPAVLNSNCLIIPSGGYPDSLCFFIDSDLNLICKAKLKCKLINDMSNDEYLNQIIVLPSKKIAGTGYLWADSIHSQDHWNFLTENIEDYLKASCLFAPDIAICKGSCVQLSASGGTNYSWSPSTGLSSTTGCCPTACPIETVKYTLENDAFDTTTVKVTVNSLPTIDATNDTCIYGTVVQLCATGSGINYSWSGSSFLSCTTCTCPLADPLITTTYIVTTTDQNGCRNSDSTIVWVRPDCASNLKQIEEHGGLLIFPNPLISFFIIQFDPENSELKDAEVIIYDMLGKEMERKKLTWQSQLYGMEIERGSLVSGVYFVKVRGVEREWVEKIVVE